MPWPGEFSLHPGCSSVCIIFMGQLLRLSIFLVPTEECNLIKALMNVQTQTKKAKNKNLDILVEAV